MAESVPTPIPAVLDYLRADATLLALSNVASEVRVDGSGEPVLPWTLVRIVSGPGTTSDLPELLAAVQIDVFAARKVDAQTILDRVLWLVENLSSYRSTHGTLRGAVVTGYRDLSEWETEGRYRLTLDVAFTIQRPD